MGIERYLDPMLITFLLSDTDTSERLPPPLLSLSVVVETLFLAEATYKYYNFAE